MKDKNQSTKWDEEELTSYSLEKGGGFLALLNLAYQCLSVVRLCLEELSPLPSGAVSHCACSAGPLLPCTHARGKQVEAISKNLE